MPRTAARPDTAAAVAAERLALAALIATPDGTPVVIADAVVADPDAVRPDAEHDDLAWWDPDPARWPDEAAAPLRMLAALLGPRRPDGR